MAFPFFPNTSSSDLSTIPTLSMPQNEAVMVSFSGVTYFTHSTTTSSTFTQYVEQEPPLWPPSLPQFQLMRNPTAQSLVGLGPPVTGNYTAYPEQQQSSITPRTPRAERQTNGKYIELSNFPSEEGVIDGLLPSDKNYPTPQPLVGLGPPVTAYIELSNFPSEEGAIDELLPSDKNYPTPQPLVGLGPPVTGNYTAYPEQQQSSITPRTPRAERQTNGKYIELSNFPSEEGVIDGLLPSDKNYPTPQPLVGLGPPVTGNYTHEPHIPAVITNNPEQQHSSITPRTPRAERQTNEKHINLSIFSSEEDAIDELLPSDDKYIPSQTKKRTRMTLKYDAKLKLMQKISAGDKEDAELAEECRVPVKTVQYFRQNMGVLLKPPKKKDTFLSEEEIDNLKQDLCMDERLSDDELQKKYNISSSTLMRVKKSAGLDTKKDHKKRKKLTMDEELNLIDDLCKEGIARLSNADLAQKYNISTDTIRRRVKKHQLQQKNYLRDVSDNFKKYFQRDSSLLFGEAYVNPFTNR